MAWPGSPETKYLLESSKASVQLSVMALPSGLEAGIGDAEDLARFLTSSGHFNATMAKPAAFLPNPKDQETSVFRHGKEPSEALWQLGAEYAARDRTLHGAAVFAAGVVRSVGLAIESDEPPDRHAAIRNWPWNSEDPALQKAQQKELAAVLAGTAELARR